MSTNDLPDYGLEDDQDVPSYSTRRPLTPRTFTNRSLAVTLRSYAKSAESVPVFVKGAMLKGDIKFSPTARETIKEASVTIICYRVVTNRKGGAQGDVGENAFERPFAEIRTVILPTSGDQPTVLAPGSYTWPFSIELPSTFRDQSGGKEYPLPPTYHPRMLPEYIDYKIVVNVKRKGWTKSDLSLNIPFIYIPLSHPTVPISPSVARAYEDGSPLPLPWVDPDAYAITSIPVKGQLFDKHNVEFECQVSLMTPTQYAVGRPLQFFVKFLTAAINPPSEAATQLQTQLLDLLTTPGSVSVALVRKYGVGNVVSSKTGGVPVDNVIAESVETANLWKLKGETDEDDEGGEGERTMQGEIIIPTDLTPDFEFPSIHLSYALVITIPAPGFVLTSPSVPPYAGNYTLPSKILVLPIQITHSPWPGVKPIPYAPAPTYLDKSEQQKKRNHLSIPFLVQ